MKSEDKRVDITVARIVIREILGRPWLILRDTEGHTYQMADCLDGYRSGTLTEESEAVLLMQPGDKVSLRYRVRKHGALELETANVIKRIRPTAAPLFNRPPSAHQSRTC